MNGLDYYTRQNDSWETTELGQLRKEYTLNEMSVSEIADLHRRTPGAIAFRLKAIGIVSMHTESRGYEDYKNSKLYKEIIQTAKRSTKKTTQATPLEATPVELNTPRQVARIQRKAIPSDISQLKQDVKELKDDVKTILELMRAVYEFENA